MSYHVTRFYMGLQYLDILKCLSKLIKLIRDSSVGIATGYELDDQGE
jgi:hypothetical protein